jgi:mannose-1-phosphate guanylyltransferase
MKAFLLAAGIGSRLRPITDTIPKCMVSIDGTALLDIWLAALNQAGVHEVLINTHHLPGAVSRHVARRTDPPEVRTTFEARLLGSAGTLVANRRWVDQEEAFLVCYADNLTDFDLRQLIEFHAEGDAIASLAVFRSPRPSAGGVVELDGTGRLVSFAEKPARPTSDLVNAGIYVFRSEVLDEIDLTPPQDIGYDLLPRLVGRARALPIDGYFRDIGTIDAYLQAQADWRPRAIQ